MEIKPSTALIVVALATILIVGTISGCTDNPLVDDLKTFFIEHTPK